MFHGKANLEDEKIAFQGKFSVPLAFDLQRTTDIL